MSTIEQNDNKSQVTHTTHIGNVMGQVQIKVNPRFLYAIGLGPVYGQKRWNKMSLKQIVGQKTYSTWVDMLRRLVPEGRTHRLAPLVAGMMQVALAIAYEKYGADPEEGSVAQVLLLASEAYDPSEAEDLIELVAQLFDDANVGYERTSSRGDDYSIVESAVYEFIHWFDMPWEA